MIFGEVPVAQCVGAILAHSTKTPSGILKKGRVLDREDAALLAAAGISKVVAARLEADDVGENAAAASLAPNIAGKFVECSDAATGRVNLFAASPGLVLIDRAEIDRFNLVDEAITLATVAPYARIEAKRMLATLKIIPFAVKRASIEQGVAIASKAGGLIAVAPFQPRKAALVQTTLPGLKESVQAKTVETTKARLAALGSALLLERRCAHHEAALAPVIGEVMDAGAELVLIAGASAIVDRLDVIPAAIAASGGTIDHFGMPVDPGNLLLIGRRGGIPILGLPGCARSPKINGFDFVLERLLAGLEIGPDEIMRMGVGGLLADIPSRPLPRARATQEPAVPAPSSAPRIAAIILAAGQSQRMGGVNKLLVGIGGKPMIRRVTDIVSSSSARPIFVVTGHQRTEIEGALAGLDISTIHNPDYKAGLSTSLRCGLGALPGDIDGALICLGDMPLISVSDIERLIAAFNPVEGRAICVPIWGGKRGNPVLWPAQLFPEMRMITGDVGARHLISTYPELVAEIDMMGDAVLTDLDTPDSLAQLAETGLDVSPKS